MAVLSDKVLLFPGPSTSSMVIFMAAQTVPRRPARLATMVGSFVELLCGLSWWTDDGAHGILSVPIQYTPNKLLRPQSILLLYGLHTLHNTVFMKLADLADRYACALHHHTSPACLPWSQSC